ncbi:MAG: phosphate uptake regulator PhoU [Bacteroidetes bacterium]|nr:phosphate uptake regulator PhoU [Bacteroidota bacterium]
MKSKKNNALKKIRVEFENFSNLVLQQLNLLENIMSDFSVETIGGYKKKLEETENKLDQYEVRISERIINTIVLYQPMASDLRQIFAIYRMSLNLERIGDMVISIYNNISQIKDPKIFSKNSKLIENMLILSSNMVTKALLSFTNNDKEYAIWAIKNDSIIDELNYTFIKKSILKDQDGKIKILMQSYINIKEIVTDIERISDHATNIAEASIYASEGTDIRHTDIKHLKD